MQLMQKALCALTNLLRSLHLFEDGLQAHSRSRVLVEAHHGSAQHAASPAPRPSAT
jgi:hypothetical protein